MSTQPAAGDQTNRLIAALAYPITIIVALIIILTDMKKDPFMRHHGWTGLFWGIVLLIIQLVVGILGDIRFVNTLGRLAELAWLILAIYYAVQTYNGKEFTIPVVSDFAKKYAK